MELPGEKDASRFAGYLKSIGTIGGAVVFAGSFWFVTKAELKAHAEADEAMQSVVAQELRALGSKLDENESKGKERFFAGCVVQAKGDGEIVDLCIKTNK